MIILAYITFFEATFYSVQKCDEFACVAVAIRLKHTIEGQLQVEHWKGLKCLKYYRWKHSVWALKAVEMWFCMRDLFKMKQLEFHLRRGNTSNIT